MQTSAVVAILAGGVAGLWLIGTGGGEAADSEAIRAAVLKLATAIEKKDTAEAKKQVDALKGASLLDLMDLFKPRTSEGLGVGPKPGAIQPDGIEAKLRDLASGKQASDAKRLDDEAEHLVRMAYTVAAIAESAHGKATAKARQDAKDLRKWQEWSVEARKAAVELAEATKAKDSKGVRAAAGKVNTQCNACHTMFR